MKNKKRWLAASMAAVLAMNTAVGFVEAEDINTASHMIREQVSGERRSGGGGASPSDAETIPETTEAAKDEERQSSHVVSESGKTENVQSGDENIVDEDGNVSITDEDEIVTVTGQIPDEVFVAVEKEEIPEEQIGELCDQYDAEELFSYTIRLEDADGDPVDLEETVQVTIHADVPKRKLVHLFDLSEEDPEELKCKVTENGDITFEADSFSSYTAVVGKKSDYWW